MPIDLPFPRIRGLLIGCVGAAMLLGIPGLHAQNPSGSPPPIQLFRCAAVPSLPTVSVVPELGAADSQPSGVLAIPAAPALGLSAGVPGGLGGVDLEALPAYHERQLRWVMSGWTSPLEREPGAGFYHQAMPILFPEPATIGSRRVKVGGGLVTAIQRLNPLGLLNFELLHVSF